jgi:pyruvate dehydrogenase E1 component alpha subunit
MGTIIGRTRKDGTAAYVAQILIKRKGQIAHRESQTFDRKQAAKAWLARRETELAQPGALEKGDDVIPSFRTRGAMIAMGVPIEEQIREFLHTPRAAGDSRDAPHHASWPELGVMPGSTMIGGHLAMAAGIALANQCDGASHVSVAFFGDGTLGSGDLYETMHMAGAWKLPLILVCENNGWEMSTPWANTHARPS